VRNITPADVGLPPEALAQLKGSVTEVGGTKILRIEMIEAAGKAGLLPHLRGLVPRVLATARSQGVKVLQLEGNFGNSNFMAWIAANVARYGGTFASTGGHETITFVLGR